VVCSIPEITHIIATALESIEELGIALRGDIGNGPIWKHKSILLDIIYAKSIPRKV
jgi:hypothetical protein